jgi:hypothetical protein
MKSVLIGFVPLFLFVSSALAESCYDISTYEPEVLEGELSFRIFAGPPNFEDVQRGDTPEPGYVLVLPSPICITGDDEFTDPDFSFDEVQLVPERQVQTAMRHLTGRPVVVELNDHLPAMTGHHHRPLVVWVKAIREVNSKADPGSAGPVVVAFYEALSAGEGRLAASFVIPEKTIAGPLSAKALNSFYGNLSQPLQLLGITEKFRHEYSVKYHFVAGKNVCDGEALVHTESRNGRNFVSSIKALNGC